MRPSLSQSRVALGDQGDAGAEADGLRGRREEAETGNDVQHAAALGHRDAAVLAAGIGEGVAIEQDDVFAHPDGIEAHAFRPLAEVADHGRGGDG